MPSTRRQKAKARRSREMDMLSDYDNLDVMLGNENNNPIERELAEAIDQSSAHGDDDTNVYHENEFRDYLHENEPLRQNEVRQSFEAFSSEFNLRLSQEMESMMSIMHSQINRAITTAIAERVIPEIQNIANSMSSMGHRDTEASSSPNSQENRESAPGPKIKIAKKDSRSVGDLRDTMGHGSYIGLFGCLFGYFFIYCYLSHNFVSKFKCALFPTMLNFSKSSVSVLMLLVFGFDLSVTQFLLTVNVCLSQYKLGVYSELFWF